MTIHRRPSELALGLATAMLIASPSLPAAGATPPDQVGFIQTVRQLDIPLNDDQAAYQLGYLICAGARSQGLNNVALLSLLQDQPWSEQGKHQFIEVAQKHLCP